MKSQKGWRVGALEQQHIGEPQAKPGLGGDSNRETGAGPAAGGQGEGLSFRERAGGARRTKARSPSCCGLHQQCQGKSRACSPWWIV